MIKLRVDINLLWQTELEVEEPVVGTHHHHKGLVPNATMIRITEEGVRACNTEIKLLAGTLLLTNTKEGLPQQQEDHKEKEGQMAEMSIMTSTRIKGSSTRQETQACHETLTRHQLQIPTTKRIFKDKVARLGGQ